MSKSQPSSRQCFVCGVANPAGLKIQFIETTPGEVIADYIVPAEYQGYPGIVHGGIVAAMLDEISGRAHMGSGEDLHFMYTARIEVRYRRHVPVAEPLRLVGRVGKRRGKIATATGAIYDQQDNLLAECESLLVDVPQEAWEGVDLKELGWRVYDYRISPTKND